jgi:hypothetical protein
MFLGDQERKQLGRSIRRKFDFVPYAPAFCGISVPGFLFPFSFLYFGSGDCEQYDHATLQLMTFVS